MHHELESLIERQLQSKAEYQNIKPVYILPRDPATIEYFETEIANNDRDLIIYYSYHKDNNEDLFPPYGVHVMDESADNLENKHPIQDLLDSSYYDSRQYHTEL
ncbi:hypothetical protein H1Q59_08405 [Holosporaceae bacterium 'Namur']|nr:hypothetical protein [Holosporaceae bacterium 'Namur']